MSLVIKPNKKQALNLEQQLNLLALPKKKRVRVLKTLGRYERAKARKRIRDQRTVTGQKFSPRTSGKKAKMLKKLGRTLEPYVKSSNRLELKHKNKLTGRIAAMHQEGVSETMTASRMKKKNGTPDYDAPCTNRQAIALRSVGYKVKRKKGKGSRKGTIKEIMERFTIGQAGFLLRTFRKKKSKQSWQIPVEARAFLGDMAIDVQDELFKILDNLS